MRSLPSDGEDGGGRGHKGVLEMLLACEEAASGRQSASSYVGLV